MIWKPEWFDAALKLMEAGATQLQIAEGLNAEFNAGITRSAVAGQITRGNLVPPPAWLANAKGRQAEGRRQANKNRRATAPARRKFKHNMHQNSLRRGGMAQTYLLPKTYVELVEPITEEGKTFAGLGQNDCRWWIGSDADGAMRFCGCPRHRQGSFYCEAHAAKSVRIEREDVLEREVREALKAAA